MHPEKGGGGPTVQKLGACSRQFSKVSGSHGALPGPLHAAATFPDVVSGPTPYSGRRLTLCSRWMFSIGNSSSKTSLISPCLDTGLDTRSHHFTSAL